ncbi:MAG: hypothetical protein RQ754_02945 [Desulfuromonadales bacterium]|nr:hypothetical protein [Desulfuromonadales bacterium]
MRGFIETAVFREKMMETLNLPRNRQKGSWSSLSLARLLWLALVEYLELVGAALFLIYASIRYERRRDAQAWLEFKRARRHVMHEAADVGNCAMFLHNWAEKQEDYYEMPRKD